MKFATMKSRFFYPILLGLFALLTLSGCLSRISQLRPQYSLPTNSAKILQDLAKIDPQEIGEIGNLLDPNVAGNIIAMAQLDSEDKLSAVYNDGYIRLWDLTTQSIVLEYNIGFTSADSTSFSADGLSLITPNKVLMVPTESENETTIVLDGINLWDTQTGVQIGCFGFHCQSQQEQYDSVTQGAILSPRGDWLVKYARTALYSINISGNRPDTILNLDDQNRQTKQHISKASFDPSGEYFAVAYEEGIVTIYEFESAIDGSNWINMLSIGKSQDTRRSVISVKIDSTRTWLALLFKDELQIWDLKHVKNKPSISFSISSMNAIAFDKSGTLLFVGTKSGLRIIDLQQNKEVAQFGGDVDVSSVLITADNRWLVWGDTNGIIHLWGATIP